MTNHPIDLLRVLALATGLVLAAGPVWAQEGGLEDKVAAGRTALADGAHDQAVELFEEVLAAAPDRAEAYYDLARAYMAPSPLRDLDRAERLLDEALARRPEDIRFLELDLERYYLKQYRWLPMLQEARRDARARRLLRADPGNAMAHFVLGVSAYESFDDAFDGVEFGGPGGGSEAWRAMAAYRLDADVAEADSGGPGRLVFQERAGTGLDVPVVRKRENARAVWEESRDHLMAAIKRAPTFVPAYRFLVAGAVRTGDLAKIRPALFAMREALPEHPEAWLYTGLSNWHRGDLEAAEQAFRRAMMLLPDEERTRYNDPSRLAPTPGDTTASAERAPGYWATRDPRLLTDVNERLVEHYARMVYADLRFGDPKADVPGWQTEPGEVVLRYGVPEAEASYTTRTDRYRLFHYGDLEFRFMDLVKTGDYTFYSPPADAFAGARVPNRAGQHDYAIRAPETFRRLPERTAYEPEAPVFDVPFQVSAFRGDSTGVDVVVAYGWVDSTEAVPAQRGVFLVDPESGRVHADRGTSSAFGRHDSLALGVATMTAEAGTYMAAVELEMRDPEQVGQRRTSLLVPSLTPDALTLSDLLLAYGAEDAETDTVASPGRFVRNGLDIQPAPWSIFAEGEPVYLYFEIYNLQSDDEGAATTRYEVEATLTSEERRRGLVGWVRRVFGGADGGGVAASFEAEGQDAAEHHYLLLDLRDRAPGTYQLILTVKDRQSGRQAERSRRLVIAPAE